MFIVAELDLKLTSLGIQDASMPNFYLMDQDKRSEDDLRKGTNLLVNR